MRSTPVTEWSFALADEPAASAKAFDDASWRRVTVPHDWSVEHPFSPEHASGTGYLPGGVGWYRAHVSLSSLEAQGRHLRLVFHGVYKRSTVWVNGYHLGGRPSGWARFSFDLTEIASYAPNDDLVIAVRVDHTDIADSRWYNGSGITRRVELETHEAVQLAEHGTVFTIVSATPETAEVRIASTIANRTDSAVSVRVQHELRSLSSERVEAFETAVDVPAGGEATATAEAAIAAPELWSDLDPHLHRLVTRLVWAGEEAEYAEVVGVRVIRFDPDHGFFVNDEPRKLKGVCLHEDAGPFGTAVPAVVWLRRLLKLREMGANAVRMAHNPHAPELYALCDLLGLFVIDEAFDEWENPKNKWWQGHNVYPPKHEGPADHFPEWHERDLAAMVRAHRNHPSVVAWSIGNEVDYPNDPYAHPLFQESVGNNDAGKPAAERVYDPDRPDIRRLTTIARRLAAIVREHDRARPVTLAAAFPELSGRTGLLDDLDLIGYNYRESRYAEDHARFPHTPFVGSETSHRYVDWLAARDLDFIAGQFLWTGVDFLGETKGWPSHGSGAGLLTIAGFPKTGWHLRRSWWSEQPTAHIVVRPLGSEGLAEATRRWTATGDRVEVLCFASGGEPVLEQAGDRIALAWHQEHGWWSAEVSPGPDPLTLTVRREGAVVARDALAVTGAPARLEATTWSAGDWAERAAAIGIDLDEVLQIDCTVVDADGAPALDDLEVTVEVTGGELVGVESGDLADPTAYSEHRRRTFDGHVLVCIVRRGELNVLSQDVRLFLQAIK